MRFLAAFTSVLAYCGFAKAQAVFAHFMVGNTKAFGLDDWTHEIRLAQEAGIDAFALNMANNEATNSLALPLAFDAATSLGFKLFFSFDYAGNGAWDKTVVRNMIIEYGVKSAYFKRGLQPFVSTFEGPDNAADWTWIKDETKCFFIPDWSSVGAQPAVRLAEGVADGLFSWDAWPKGPANMTTYPDASYYDFLGSKPYMMPISPWFYTNLPGYGKNWLWRGDDMWFQRWQQAITIDRRPDYIQIISWNDFGESHYIGPLDERQYEAFDIGRAPFNYVRGMPHDGWRETLPYYISMYKFGSATITQERIVSWYRVNKNGACSDGGTTGNTANQLQVEYSPNVMMQDRIFYDVLLASPNAQVQVSIGGVVQQGGWDQEPYGGVGLYHGSVPIGSASGPVVVTLKRGGTAIATINGASITSSCTNGLNNYNPWVGSGRGPVISAVTPTGNVALMPCVQGFGVFEFSGVCAFACTNGYCPSAACTCLKRGVANPPNATGVAGYPLPGKSGSFKGLCSFDCNHGYCPDTVCGHEPNDGVVLNYSPFLPPACTGGTGAGAFAGLCDFGCHLGFCPIHVCTCTATGVLVQTPPKTNVTGYYIDPSVDDHGLCKFAVEHGYYPDVCGQRPVSGGDGVDGGSVIYVPTTVWDGSGNGPKASCIPPCILVLPPSPIGSTTTIPWPLLTTTLLSSAPGGGVRTITTTISIPAITTTAIDFWPVTVSVGDPTSAIFRPLQSVKPPPVPITLPPNVETVPPSPIPVYSNGSPVSSSTTTTTTVVPVVFVPTSHRATIQPQPTVSVSLPKQPTVTYTSAKPASTCQTGCGTYDCRQFGCGGSQGGGGGGGGGCGLFGCGGGCSIHGCGGGCGLFGCGNGCLPIVGCPPGNQCPLNMCGGPGCKNGGCGTQSEGDCEPREANDCTLVVSSTLTATPSKYSTTTRTNCHKYAACDASDKTTTSTQTEPVASYPTVTVTASQRDMDRQPASLISAISLKYVADQYSWNLARFGPMVTGGGSSASTAASTSKPMPAGPTPTPGHGTKAPSWWMIYYQLRDSSGETQDFYGYDDGWNTYCSPEPATWKKVGGQIAKVPSTLTGITVYGDSSCSFAASDMSLRCNKWATATCVDRTSGINYGGGGTCRVDAGAGIYQYYQVIMSCSW